MNQFVAPRWHIITAGLAMFSMFFGAANVVFPLMLGFESGALVWYAITGFTLTAVASPFVGLVSMVLYQGDYKKFFFRLGRLPGMFFIVLIVSLIGPFAGIPRCIALSYTTIALSLPNISLFWFSLFFALGIFALSVRESKIIDVLGKVLSPLLLCSLLLIVVRGLWGVGAYVVPDVTPGRLFLESLYSGYQTMDLLAAMFFSSVVLVLLNRVLRMEGVHDGALVRYITFRAGLVGACLLGLVYSGLSLVAARWSAVLAIGSVDESLGALSAFLLGDIGGFLAGVTVVLACLTTAITLATVFSTFLHAELCMRSVSYTTCLVITILVSVFFANQGFAWIITHVWPILKICYPALVMLACMNILYKTIGFSMVKIPVFVTLCITGIVMFSADIIALARSLGLYW